MLRGEGKGWMKKGRRWEKEEGLGGVCAMFRGRGRGTERKGMG